MLFYSTFEFSFLSSTFTFNFLLLYPSDDFAGHGNAFHGKGGRGNKRAQMRYCLHLMRSVVSLNDSEVNQDLVDQGAINQLLGEMSDLWSPFNVLAVSQIGR